MRFLLTCAILALGSAAAAQPAERPPPVPAAVGADPVPDAAHPPRHVLVSPQSHGTRLNGTLYGPAGAGSHPAALLLAGLPGEGDNADLAEAMRRDGWIVLTVSYRGAFGGAGSFSLAHALEDGAAAVQWLRSPDGGGALGVDPARIVLVGDRLGGWIAALTTARDPALLGAALISPVDVGGVWGKTPRAALAADLDKRMGGPDARRPLSGGTPETLAEEAAHNALLWSFAEAAPGLRGRSLLVISASGAPADGETLADTLITEGEPHVHKHRLESDASYSGTRIALQADVLRWLENLPGAPEGL